MVYPRRAPMGPVRELPTMQETALICPACAQRAATATDGIDGCRSSEQPKSSTAGWRKERCCESRAQIGQFRQCWYGSHTDRGNPDENHFAMLRTGEMGVDSSPLLKPKRCVPLRALL